MAVLDSEAHLALTRAFIDQRPLPVVVMRSAKVATPDGGTKKGAPVARPAQTVRIVEMLRAQATTTRTTDDGDQVIPSHVAIAMPDTDFQRKDIFTAYGERWEVVHVSRLPEWRLSLELYSRGAA